jgi:hypothetical protein
VWISEESGQRLGEMRNGYVKKIVSEKVFYCCSC